MPIRRERSDAPEVSELTEEKKKARAKAMRLLEHMDRTEKGLYEKLRMADFSEAAAADAMSYVKSFGYINDARYAEVYLRSRIHSKSKRVLMLELQQKGIDRRIIEEVLEELTEEEEPDEKAMIRGHILKKYEAGSSLSQSEFRRLWGQLQRKGFRSGEILEVFRELEICSEKVDAESDF